MERYDGTNCHLSKITIKAELQIGNEPENVKFVKIQEVNPCFLVCTDHLKNC